MPIGTFQPFKRNSAIGAKALQGPLQGLDFASRRLIYKHFNAHPELQAYLDELLAFSLPQIEKALATGRNLYDIVEEHLELEPIGVQPLYRDEGYLFVYDEDQKRSATTGTPSPASYSTVNSTFNSL